jgi:class 3 adenylate cyclase
MFTQEKTFSTELKGQRTLAAIVFTDVVGYSALMAANEEYTLDLLRRDLQMIKQLCQRFEGKVLKTIGDAVLMYFSSAVKAVGCAQAIQSSLAELAVNLAPEDVLTHRVGIHLGDVFFNGSDVMGDGVNVAARLQAEAQPGGICMSQTIFDVVKTPLGLKATDLIPRKLKNIPGSVMVYQIPPIHPNPYTAQWEFGLTALEPSSDGSDLIVYSSGQWVLLHDRFFQLETYSHNSDGKLIIQIPSKSNQDDAAIQALRPTLEKSPLIKFAYQNDGLLVKVRSVESSPRPDGKLWTLTLEPKPIKIEGHLLEQSYKGHKQSYTAHDIAKLKVRRLLLNDPPKLVMLRDAQLFSPAMADREMLENLIKNSATPIKIEDCVLQSLYPQYKDNPKVLLELARLQTVFFLKTAGVIEQVIELALGPICNGKVHVRFRGKRRQVYNGLDSALIEIEGDCPLVSQV